MTRKVFLSLPTLALALLGVAACSPGSDVESVEVRERYIEARGRAIVEFLPNRASFSVTYEARDARSDVASGRATIRANIATDAMREIAGDQVVITSNVRVEPYYQQIEVQTGEFSFRTQENEHPDALIGYIARATVSVELLDPDLAAEVRGAAQAAGPVSGSRIEFALRPTAEHHREAFAAAVRDAAARARIVAEASDSVLDGIVSLREGNQPCVGQATSPGYDEEASDRVIVTGSRIGRSELTNVSPLQAFSGEIETQDSEELVSALVDAAGTFALASDVRMQSLTSYVCAIFAVEAE